MNGYFAAAGILAFLVGLAHSVIGEILVFRRMRHSGIIPTNGGDVLHERHVRILWSTWHALTALGWCIAAILLWLAFSPESRPDPFIEHALIAGMAAGSALVFIGTKARHPGWIGLLGVAVLVWAGQS